LDQQSAQKPRRSGWGGVALPAGDLADSPRINRRASEAEVQNGEAKGCQVVLARGICGRVRSGAVGRGVVQGALEWASWLRKKPCYRGVMSVNTTHPEYEANLAV
jgi:hypothetical protein